MKKEVLMHTRIIGIVDNLMYIEGLYAGDHFHSFTMTDWTKSDMISRGVKEFASRIELDEYHNNIFWEEMDNAVDKQIEGSQNVKRLQSDLGYMANL